MTLPPTIASDYPPHDERAARIKERCVDNAVRLDGQWWCARQPEVQSKLDVLGSPPVMAAEVTVCWCRWNIG